MSGTFSYVVSDQGLFPHLPSQNLIISVVITYAMYPSAELKSLRMHTLS